MVKGVTSTPNDLNINMSIETALAFVSALLILTFLCLFALVILVIRLYQQKRKLESQIDNQVQARFQVWLERECESIRVQQKEIAFREASTQLQQWMHES